MKLVESRVEKGLTISALSRASQVTRATIKRVESGRSVPTVETCWKIATAVGVTPQEIAEFTASFEKETELQYSARFTYLPAIGKSQLVPGQ